FMLRAPPTALYALSLHDALPICFHRVRGARSRTHEGSGIGLALVHELVRLHGGTVSVSSQLGQGSTFTVSIPRGSAHLPAERLGDRKSTRLNSSHDQISYAVFCL